VILSFAWTTDAYMAGRKTCTRRMWKDRTLRAWQRAWDEGRRRHVAVDKLLCWGGRRIGEFELTARPERQALRDMPETDLAAEGGLWASRDEFIRLFGGPDLEPAVIRFRPIGGEPADG
jgi:hypothetical protein